MTRFFYLCLEPTVFRLLNKYFGFSGRAEKKKKVHMSHLPECCQGDGNKVLQQIESTLDMDQDNLMQSLQPDALLDKKLPFALKMNQAMRVN